MRTYSTKRPDSETGRANAGRGEAVIEPYSGAYLPIPPRRQEAYFMGLPSLRFRNDDRFFRVLCEPTAEPAIALLLMLHV